MATSTAIAESPHFKKGGVPKCTIGTTSVTCTGTLAGLGNANLVLDLTAPAEGTFSCVNNGGNESPGQNKIPFTATSSTTIQSGEIKNGSVTFTTNPAPATPPTATAEQVGCPNGYRENSPHLKSIEFQSIELKISQSTLLFTCTASGPFTPPQTVQLSCS